MEIQMRAHKLSKHIDHFNDLITFYKKKTPHKKYRYVCLHVSSYTHVVCMPIQKLIYAISNFQKQGMYIVYDYFVGCLH